jgi:2-hydroxy-3-keto-5-methylthiopentenyl-1-phosphate phosphatase
MMRKKWMIFCDFDGTITERDMIISIMEKFGRPGWEMLKEDVLAGRISVESGVGQMFAQIPSEEKEQIVKYAQKTAKIRSGFKELLQYCRQEGILFLVTSGGIDFFVKPILSPYVDENRIFCNGSDFSGETIRILWPYGCDEHCDGGCGLCKPAILRRYGANDAKRIVIGDSITDWKAAQMADHVFARSLLLEKCRESAIPHTPFHTFIDVIETLKQWEEECKEVAR